MWKKLEFASGLISDLRYTVEWSRTWLVDFNTGKNQLVLFDLCNNSGAIDVKWDGSVIEENHILRCLDFLSVLN